MHARASLGFSGDWKLKTICATSGPAQRVRRRTSFSLITCVTTSREPVSRPA